MGNSLINFKDEQYWIKDYELEPIIYFIYKAFEAKLTTNQIDESRIKLIESFNKELELYFIGANEGSLDLNIPSLSKDTIALKLLNEVLFSIAIIFGSINIDLTKENFKGIGDYCFGVYQPKNFRINTKILSQKTNEISNLFNSNYIK